MDSLATSVETIAAGKVDRFNALQAQATPEEIIAVEFLANWVEKTGNKLILSHHIKKEFERIGCKHPLSTAALLESYGILKKTTRKNGSQFRVLDGKTNVVGGGFLFVTFQHTVYEITDDLWLFMRQCQGKSKSKNESRTPPRRRINRRPGGKQTPRLTGRQLEAHRLYGETNGNMSEVARRMGVKPTTAKQHYDAANEKLGRIAGSQIKPKTQSLPRDRRGQETVSDPDE